jgi:hypothetical protein
MKYAISEMLAAHQPVPWLMRRRCLTPQAGPRYRYTAEFLQEIPAATVQP